MSSTALASAKPRLALVSRARTRSPGSPPDDEDDVAVGARDAAAAVGERVDLEHQLLAPPGPRAGSVCGRAAIAPIVAAPWPSTSSATGERAERFGEELEPRVLPAPRGPQGRARDRGIYDSYADLFARDAVDGASRARRGGGERRGAAAASLPPPFRLRRARGDGDAAEAAELAGLEASLEVDAGDGPMPYRAVVIAQANEVDAERREALEEARNAVLEERLNPIYRRALERAHEICGEFGWPSYADAYAELRGDRPGAAARRRPRASSGRPRSATGGARLPARASRAARPGRAPPVGPAAVLPRGGARRAVPGGAAGRVVRGDARRARDRPARPAERPSGHRVPPDQVAARLLPHAAGSRRDLPGDRADRRARRLRVALPRGWPHGALREHRAGARV